MFACRGCPYGHTIELPPVPKKWKGPCPHCGGHWSIVKIGRDEDETKNTLAHAMKPPERFPVGIPGFDHVLGGGLIKGSTILLGGARGTGKTTLLMLIANSLAAQNKHVLFASGEGNRDDVFLVAGRLGITSDKIEVMGNAFDADEIIARCEEIEPFLLIVDSLQTTTLDDVEGSESSTSQGIAVANRITAFCKRTKMCSIIINHLSRSGDFAGSMTVEHLVDVVMLLCKDYKAEGADEDEPETVRERFLIVDKNRVGPEGAKSLWVMTAEGQFLEREKVSPLDPSKKKKGKITPLHSI